MIISSNTTSITPLQPSTAQETADKAGKQQAPAIESDNKDNKTSTDQVDKEQRARVAELAKTDREVRAHEQAHASVGGRYTGAPSFNYERGPDGRQYATSGEVSIDTSSIPNDPQATLAKALIVQRAALAPADPSSADRRIAAEAAATATQARVELAAQGSNNRSDETSDDNSSNNETPDQETDRLDRQFIASGAVTDPAQQGSLLDLQVLSPISTDLLLFSSVLRPGLDIKYRRFHNFQSEETIMAECPTCGADVEIAKDALVGELLSCEDCGMELEILKLEPIELAEAPSAEEDWGQ